MITPLPSLDRTSPTFAAGLDALFLTQIPTMCTEINSTALDVAADADAADLSAEQASAFALAAEQAKADAANSVVAAQAVSGASKWAAGTYAEGVVVWSPINGQNYRRRAPGGSSPTDPANDATGGGARWFPLLLLQALPVLSINADATAAPNVHYAMDPPAAAGVPYTLFFPPSPQVGDLVQVSHFTGLFTCVLDPNGALLEGQMGITIRIDTVRASGIWKFTATYGWVKQ
ncbi:MAG: hypothetical protein JWP29_4711 [Rhodoferax sp.]|nr:hypothetical protein [Rhodoferax sp.]